MMPPRSSDTEVADPEVYHRVYGRIDYDRDGLVERIYQIWQVWVF
jgi:hypothetical protein